MNIMLFKNIPICIRISTLIFAIWILQAANFSVRAQNRPVIKNDTSKGERNSPPRISELKVADPINSRSGLMAFIMPLDSDFVFKQGADVNGLQEFSATDRYNTSVEIIGSEYDVKTVKWTITFTTNRDVNIKEVFRLANFLQGIAGQDAVQWLSDQHKKNLAAHPMDDYTETKEFGNRKIKFDYVPRLRYTSMMVFMQK
ncbi:MAG: hypothetical protein ACTHJ8_08390 [Mucilaginibacter sp.]